LGGLNLIAVSPVVLGKLNIIIEDKQVGVINQVKIALPWDIAGLQNDEARHDYLPLFV
jgi:hypothetical protein